MEINYNQLLKSYKELLIKHSLLEKENALLKEEKKMLKEQMENLIKRVQELEEKLNRNSSNSSKPPSSDQKKNEDTRKKGGAKAGHPGHGRALYPLDKVTERIQIKATCCPHCQQETEILDKSPYISQQLDIPPIEPLIKQYEQYSFHCMHCGLKGLSPLPEEAKKGFGPRITAFIAFCSADLHLSKRQTQKLSLMIFQLPISIGAISNLEGRVEKILAPSYQQIHNEIKSSKGTKYVDETTWRDSGKTHYMWIASTIRAVYFSIREKRDRKACREVIGTRLKGAIVTDRYSVYAYLKNHQCCWAHLKRDFQRFADKKGKEREWGEKLLDLTTQLFKYWHEYKRGCLDKAGFNRKVRDLKRIFHNEFLKPVFEKGYEKETQRFSKHLMGFWRDLWLFTRKEEIEPTNNQAERDLRSVVLLRKISYGTKSERGKRFIQTLKSVLLTLRKQSRNSFFFLQEAIESFWLNKPLPSVIPY